jgi:hypothetical protein
MDVGASMGRDGTSLFRVNMAERKGKVGEAAGGDHASDGPKADMMTATCV